MAIPELKGRTAVITGASRGIGAALARTFSLHGMNLGLFSRAAPALPESDSVLARQLDVRDEAAVQGFLEAVQDRFGDIDLWINNAGVLDPIKPIREVSVDDFRTHIDINLTGVFIGTKLYARHVRGRPGGGVLINVSSGAAWKGYAGWGAYCAGKGGVARLTDCIALEEADAGLRAHAVAPGVVDTDMQTMIRACSPEDFPEVERFRQLERDEGFNSFEYVAQGLLEIAFDPERDTSEVALEL